MAEMKNILVPIDFSLGSRVALKQALTLAERFGARVEVIHIWEPSPVVTPNQLVWVGGDADSFWRQLSGDLRKRIDELIAEEAPKHKDQIAVHIEAGYVAHSILRHIEHGSYDLVVMGTHGRTGISHLLMGSVAERIVRLSPVPVMTVRVPKEQEKAAAEERRRVREGAQAPAAR
jgi:nucleotide-binding universal stress UspA family protein